MLLKKITLFFVILVFQSFAQLYSQHALLYKNHGVGSIKKLFVISERCSGSNYINRLILDNFEGLSESHLGHKHFPPWFELPIQYYLGDQKYYTFADTDNFLFIVIFRNPYDWARSLHLHPWHSKLRNIPFSLFIRSRWKVNYEDREIIKQIQFNHFLDLNPFDKMPFRNIFALRGAKIKTMLEIRNRASNVYYINYETVRDHPQEVLNEIKEFFNLELKPYSPVIYHKGKAHLGEFKPKKYTPISNEDLFYINSQLDSVLEEEIGYTLIDNMEEG